MLIDEADRRFRPLGVVCTLVAIAGVLGAIIVLGRLPSTTRIVLSVLIALLGLIVGLVILPQLFGRGRLDSSVEAYYVAQSRLMRQGTFWFLGYFFGALACFSAPMMVLSFMVDNQSRGFQAFALVALSGYSYLVLRLWRVKVEPWLRSSGRLG